MGLEVASFLNDLNIANPVGGVDQKAQGDDHLRLIKSVLKATFPLAVAARKFRDDTASAADTLSWTLFRNRNGVASDLMGSYLITGNDSAGNETTGLRLQARWEDPANGSEDTAALLRVMIAGVETTVMTVSSAGVLFAVPMIGTGRPMTRQLLTNASASPWNKPVGCRFIFAEGSGPGGGSGGISIAGAGEAGSTGGGGSGMWGTSALIDVSAISTAAFVIPLGGAAGNSAGSAGGNASAATITFGGTTLTFNGGFGSSGYTPNLSQNSSSDGGLGASMTSVNIEVKGANNGTNGRNSADMGNADGGNGGTSVYGRAGDGPHRISAGATTGGAGTGFGAGAGGSCIIGPSGGIGGAVGAPAFIRVWELY